MLERLGARAFRGDVTLPDSLKPRWRVAPPSCIARSAAADLEQARAINVGGTENVLPRRVAAGAGAWCT
jgi:hypothetical protein